MGIFIFALIIPILLIVIALYILAKIHLERRDRVVIVRTYKPPISMPIPHPFASPFPILETPFTVKKEPIKVSTQFVAGPFMDLENANIDRLAPNDSRLASVQIPEKEPGPPPYESII